MEIVSIPSQDTLMLFVHCKPLKESAFSLEATMGNCCQPQIMRTIP